MIEDKANSTAALVSFIGYLRRGGWKILNSLITVLTAWARGVLFEQRFIVCSKNSLRFLAQRLLPTSTGVARYCSGNTLLRFSILGKSLNTM
jgi:hypothetical protein